MTEHDFFMREALELAAQAQANDEIPVGAVIVLNNKIIGRGFNNPIGLNDPTAHAEIVAIREAAQFLGNYRLPGTTLYVTLEPCSMCIGAIIHSRLECLVFGAYEPKAGAVVSAFNLLESKAYNHKLLVVQGVLKESCRKMISSFFREKRTTRRLSENRGRSEGKLF